MSDVVSSTNEPIVITGCGWVTPFAAGGIEHVLQAICERRIRPGGVLLEAPEAVFADCGEIAAEVRKEKVVALASAALSHALRSATIDRVGLNTDRVGLSIGCALAGQIGMIDFAEDVRAQTVRFVSPIRFPQTVGNYPAGALARAFGIRGPSITLACGTASGLEAIREGAAWLAAGAADVVIAGGVEVFTAALAEGLKAQRIHTAGADTVDAATGDIYFSDAACLFILERTADARDRGAAVIAEIIDAFAPSTSMGERKATDMNPGRSPEPSNTSIRSMAGYLSPRPARSIYLETATGHSFAASGAAALAAAIAWSLGIRPLRLVNSDGLSPTRATLDNMENDGTAGRAAIVVAQDGHSTCSTVFARFRGES